MFQLEPFIHQVGGHSFMLSLDGATVCKPLVEREHLFYLTIPDEVQKFLPQYYGVISVRIIQTDDGYVQFIALPPKNYVPLWHGNKRGLRKTGSIEVTNSGNEHFQEDQHESSVSGSSDLTRLNPWVLKCHRENMCSLLKRFEEGEDKAKEFIVLENLTWKFTYPCILDLKMGTRQYGDAATLAKKQSKMYKVVSTTSAKLGLRVGGMQVFQISSKHYLCRNKFYGRTLSVSGFQQALVQFLHNGVRFRSDVLPVLIRRLEELFTVLGRQETVRLYTTSLLLLYEGDDFVQESDPRNSKTLTETLVRTLSRKSDSSYNSEPNVDVKMIDFAHSTHKALEDPVVYSGPDRGFLFGLEKLINMLKSIESDYG
ncbi:inositol hexaphosphate kinase, putative [Pediculus humanus corporis]|uniref:Kinase n=1 Tax=Pediculus humanus subsp. corporis TaxID=121224 RepID=E0VAN1_PEDHC|nr:inositol hexaphosphate kinase, putative [Pediculus humanus corporis]EEB10437.1 inositol hexaphosphate kinase, putative [Pediculus humanus corporis]